MFQNQAEFTIKLLWMRPLATILPTSAGVTCDTITDLVTSHDDALTQCLLF